MNEHGFHAKRIGNHARVLAASATKTAERILGHVVALLYGNLLDRVGHVFNGNLKKTGGHLLL